MSKINNLIKEMCPNGVRYYKLSEIGNQFNGLSGKSKKDFENGNCKYITYTNIYNNQSANLDVEDYVYVNENEKQNEIKYKDILVAGSSENLEDSGMISVITKEPNEKIYLNSFCFGFRLNDTFYDKYNSDFLKHLFRDKNFRNEIVSCSFGVTRYNLSKGKFLKIRIPCPPLEVQEEIARILDKFGELEAALEVELEAELEARKNQYEFCRGNVFSSNNNLIKLDDVCNITAGGTPSKTHSEYWENGNIRWLGSTVCENKKGISEVTNYITELGLSKSSAKLLKPGTTLIAMVGATIGKVAYLDYEACTNQNVASLFPKNINELDTSYLYHACRNLYSVFLDYANGKFSMASLGYIKNLKIPLPNINEQKRIAKLLDKFDTLINDISEGLPAEIELRRKQYEYYRNKLLNFKVQSIYEEN